DGATVWLPGGRTLTLLSSPPHKERLLVRFPGVWGRAPAGALPKGPLVLARAEALHKALLVIPESASPRLHEGSWWDHRIVGCAVETDTGTELGTIREVIHTAANDVWAAVGDEGVGTLGP